MKNQTCPECGALVAPDGYEIHNRWHARLKGLPKPTPIKDIDPRLFDKDSR